MTLFDSGPDLSGLCVCGSILTLGTVHRLDGPCFHYTEPDVAHLGRFQGHSDTSRRAALDVYPRTGTQRAKVLALLVSRPVSGCTDEEVGLLLSMNPSSVRPRRIELVEGGWVAAKLNDDGTDMERENRSGSMAQVWTATRMARDQARVAS